MNVLHILKRERFGFFTGIISFVACMLKTSKMTKIRKTLMVSFLILSIILVGVGSYAKVEHWKNINCCSIVLIGLLFGIGALVVAMWRPRMS